MTALQFLEEKEGIIYTSDSEAWTVREYYMNLLQEYVRIKCLETARNVRHRAVQIISDYENYDYGGILLEDKTKSAIMNIPDKYILPEI